jgi:hypothetical protein
MNRAARFFQLTGCIAALGPLTGCLSLIKQGYSEVVGAQGEVKPITEADAASFARISSIRFEAAATRVGAPICPQSLIEAYDQAAASQATEENAVSSNGGTAKSGSPTGRAGDSIDTATSAVATVSSDIMYFQKRGLLSQAQCLTRVQVMRENQLLLDALILAESGSLRSSKAGESALAKATVDALIEYVRQRSGSSERQARR